MKARLLLPTPVVLLTVGGLLLGCDSAPEPPEEDCTPEATASGPVGEWEFLGLGGEEIDNVSAIAANPCNPRMLYVGTRSSFSGEIPSLLFKSTDGGATWDTLATGRVQGTGITDLEVDPYRPDTVYALPGGIIKSPDGGATWMNISGDLRIPTADRTALDLELAPEDPETLYLGTGGFLGGPLYKSTDGGNSWKELTENTRRLDDITDVALSPDDPHVVYVQTANLFDLYMSPDGGKTWSRRGDSGAKGDLTVDFDNAKRLYGLEEVRSEEGLEDRQVMRSPDGGRSWDVVEQGLPGGKAVRLAQDGRSGELFLLYVTEEAGRSLRVYWWEEGESWRRADSGALEIPKMPSVDDSIEPFTFARKFVVAPDRSLYLGVTNIGPAEGGLYRMKVPPRK